VNQKTRGGVSALHDSCDKGNIGIVKMLVEEFAADVNSQSDSGVTPLMNACIKGQWDIVEILVKAGADVNKKMGVGVTALYLIFARLIDQNSLKSNMAIPGGTSVTDGILPLPEGLNAPTATAQMGADLPPGMSREK